MLSTAGLEIMQDILVDFNLMRVIFIPEWPHLVKKVYFKMIVKSPISAIVLIQIINLLLYLEGKSKRSCFLYNIHIFPGLIDMEMSTEELKLKYNLLYEF